MTKAEECLRTCTEDDCTVGCKKFGMPIKPNRLEEIEELYTDDIDHSDVLILVKLLKEAREMAKFYSCGTKKIVACGARANGPANQFIELFDKELK